MIVLEEAEIGWIKGVRSLQGLWMSRGYGKPELSMVNRGIEARIATKIKQRRMGKKNILKKSEDALW